MQRKTSLPTAKRPAPTPSVPPRRANSRSIVSLLAGAACTLLAVYVLGLLHAAACTTTPSTTTTADATAAAYTAYAAAVAAARPSATLSKLQQLDTASARGAALLPQRLRAPAPAHPTWASLPNAVGRAPSKMVEYSRNVLTSSFCAQLGETAQCKHFVETPDAPFCTDAVWAKRWCAGETFDPTEPQKQSDRDGPRLHRACLDQLAGKPNAAAARERCTFFSQQLEDKEMWFDYFQNTTDDGVYLELGALNGQLYSNTKFFEETLGWGGVLIEPSTAFSTLRKGRSGGKRDNALFNVAVCKEAGEVEFADGGLFTGAQSWVSSIPGTVVSPGSCTSFFPACETNAPSPSVVA